MNRRPEPERLRIVDLATEHLNTVLRIEAETFAAPWSRTAFVREIVESRSFFYCLLRNDACVGYGGFWHIVDEMHISNIAVDAPWRGYGYGAWLLAALMRDGIARGIETATLEVREGNEIAQRMYRDFGFEAMGRRPGYYPEEGEDAIIMWNHDLAHTVTTLPPDVGVPQP